MAHIFCLPIRRKKNTTRNKSAFCYGCKGKPDADTCTNTDSRACMFLLGPSLFIHRGNLQTANKDRRSLSDVTYRFRSGFEVQSRLLHSILVNPKVGKDERRGRIFSACQFLVSIRSSTCHSKQHAFNYVKSSASKVSYIKTSPLPILTKTENIFLYQSVNMIISAVKLKILTWKSIETDCLSLSHCHKKHSF